MAEKRKKTYHFHNDWEEELFFTTVKETCVCLICGATVATAKRHNVERHFTTCHKSYHANYPPGSALRAEKACELKAALGKQQSFFTRTAKKSQKATEASFRATHFLIKKKKAFSDGEVVKEAMMIIANTVLKDEKNGTDLISTLSDVKLGESTMVRRVSGNLADQLDRDLAKCSWFSIQCDESVDSSSIAQLLVFIRMVFEDFSTREELLALLPLKTTTRGVDIYNTVKEFFVQKKVPLEKLVAVTTDGAPAMIGRHTGFIAHCKSDPDFPKFLHYHCIIHQQALCAKVIGFEHVMTPVVKIINNIRSKAKQHRIFKVLLEEMSAEYGDLLLHTEIRWLSRGRVLLRFLSLLGEIKEFKQSKGEDVSLLEDTEWTLDLAFLTDITGKLNDLNCKLQGKGKTVVDLISALNAFKAKMNIFSVDLQKKKVLHFPSVQSVLKDNASASETFDKVAEKYCEVINRLGQEFENRFCDLHQLEPCVSFISNPFMNVDTTFFAEQLSATFNLDAGQVEIEIITLQNDLHLKAYQAAPNFWCLVDTEKYSGVCTAAMKVASLFGSTYLCESAFSDMNFIKNKHRTRLTDAHLKDSLTIAVSSYTPDYNTLVNSMQCQSSH